MSAVHSAVARGLLVVLAKATQGQQLGLFDRFVQVREHVRHDATGVHVVHAHAQHHASAQAAAPPSPAAAYVVRGLRALQRASDHARHPDVKRAVLDVHRAVSGTPNPDAAARLLDAKVEALRRATAHPAAQLRVAGDRVAEATRKTWETWKAQVAADEVVARREQLKDRVEMHDLYQPFGSPRPGERGYQPAAARHPKALDGREPAEVATTLLDQALSLYEDPYVGLLLAGADEGYGDDYGYAFDEDDDERTGTVDGWTRWDLPDLFGVPDHDPAGHPYLPEQRLGIVEDALHLAAEMSGEADERDWWPGRKLPRGRSWKLPRAIAELVIEDALQPALVDNPTPRIVLVDKDTAAAFIREHHSQLPKMNAKGLMYALGLRVNGRLVAVATAGSPGGRWADPHRVLDVSRIASDSTYKGASSALMARLMELVDRSRRPGAEGPSLLVTYSLASEAGTPYRALRDKGLRPVERTEGKQAGGARPGGTGALEEQPKIRWEYGPGARPARWELLEE